MKKTKNKTGSKFDFSLAPQNGHVNSRRMSLIAIFFAQFGQVRDIRVGLTKEATGDRGGGEALPAGVRVERRVTRHPVTPESRARRVWQVVQATLASRDSTSRAESLQVTLLALR